MINALCSADRADTNSAFIADFAVPIQPTKPEPVTTKPLNENDDGMRGPGADRLLRTNLAFHGQFPPVLGNLCIGQKSENAQMPAITLI